MQLANFTYAVGQVLYKHLVVRHPSDLPHYRRFGYFYLGALAVALPAFLLFLGLCSTALGMYWWNKGACLVNGGTLAVMNNLHMPVGLLINLLIWGQNQDLGKLFFGALVIVSSVWISRRGLAQRQLNR